MHYRRAILLNFRKVCTNKRNVPFINDYLIFSRKTLSLKSIREQANMFSKRVKIVALFVNDYCGLSFRRWVKKRTVGLLYFTTEENDLLLKSDLSAYLQDGLKCSETLIAVTHNITLKTIDDLLWEVLQTALAFNLSFDYSQSINSIWVNQKND